MFVVLILTWFQILKAEQLVKSRVSIGSTITEGALRRIVEEKGISDGALQRALLAMERRDEILYRKQRKVIYRNK